MTEIELSQALKRDGGPSLYLQVADHLRARITDGSWLSGDKVPSIDVLMGEFDVARVTIREAVKILTNEGLLTTSRGRGTLVTNRAKGHRPLKLYLAFDQFVEALKNDYPNLDNVMQETLVPDLSEVEGYPAELYEFFERAHMRDGVSYCLISLYLDRHLYDQAPERFQAELVLPVLNELFPNELAKIGQRMRFGKCGRRAATRLQYPYGDPVAHVTRVIRNKDDRIIYFAKVIYRADLLELIFGEG